MRFGFTRGLDRVASVLVAVILLAVPLPALASPAAPDSAGGSGLDIGPVSPRLGRTDARIRYVIAHAAPVRVTILDARGREVATLSNGFQQAGEHEARWNGLRSSGALAPSGLYIAHVRAAGASGSRHLILVQ